jgi:uncharacterized membrane protein
MSTLVAIEYDDMYKADETRLLLLKLEKEGLVDLEDAVVAYRDEKGEVRLSQCARVTATSTARGAYWGAYLGWLIGLVLLSPLFGLAVGAGAGAVKGALSDVGIEDDFMTELARGLTRGSSALFVLVRKSSPDKLLEKLKGSGGKILMTTLKHEDAARLQAVVNAPTE